MLCDVARQPEQESKPRKEGRARDEIFAALRKEAKNGGRSALAILGWDSIRACAQRLCGAKLRGRWPVNRRREPSLGLAPEG